MIIIRLKGGLGNQMFQFALGYVLSETHKCPLKIDTRFFDLSRHNHRVTTRDFELDIFNNSYNFASKKDILQFDQLSVIHRINKKLGFNYLKKYNEPSPVFQQDLSNIKPPLFLNGYFQSHHYYRGYEEAIRALFSFPTEDFQPKNRDILNTLNSETTLGIHIRRGDYISDPKTNQTHGVCSVDYYMKAIEQLTKNNDKMKLVFFSDDSKWVKNTFEQLSMDKLFVDHNTGKDSWKDLCLMSKCTHNIIANSSFSWWAAWLNAHPQKKVIAPKQWFADRTRNTNDLIPETWIRL
ncbi:alpha-1,2-fucosyltransferase [Psychroserpens sp. SPM9]|uniref:alpha-1,2-fucosyltransferase n=1 Tax=Psychroserpens sp. SPM9 TaxID=2975598 RepID=UPI0021A70EFC|nr:alpha-1,2-fucosyltransferase [Psychroserpens sp. SPM9]MDG5492245.1 alpha-1,2-fucosyltransferase [Psychroserpens sp. SPM9]